MIGRFLLGSGLGALVGTGLLALASVFSPPPAIVVQPSVSEETTKVPEPKVPEPEAPAKEPEIAPEEAPATETKEEAVTEKQVEPEAAPAPTAQPEEPVVEGKAPEPDTEAPETAAAPSAEEGPKAPESSAAPEAAESPETLTDLSNDQSPEAPESPAVAPDVAAATAPEELPSLIVVEQAPAAPAEAEAPAVVASPEVPAAPVAEAAPAGVDPLLPPPPSPEEEAALAEPASEGAETSPESSGTDVATAKEKEVAPLPDAPAPAGEEPAVIADEQPPSSEVTPETTPDEEVSQAQLETDPSLPSASGLPETAEGVTTGRLPKIGDAAASEGEAALSDDPSVKYARAFENPEGKPAFAIVLIDEGDPALDRAALAALPIPVTMALDPSNPQAAEQAAIYRAAGLEVVMIASGLPEGAAASDVEVAMAAMAQVLPEAVVVMDVPEQAFQGNRALASLMVPVIAGQGRGVLTWDEGLNAADQVARREEVPSAVVFRDLDGEGETSQVIRRYLDRAAFKAAQEGKVTVVGRARPDTIAAILEWTVEGRAATVALAPLTAVLSAE